MKGGIYKMKEKKNSKERINLELKPKIINPFFSPTIQLVIENAVKKYREER